MGELKHGFGAAKMNKDADERIVPNGEYRDALNIEISTSEDSNVGTMQTLLGNSNITNSQITALISSNARCVGSIADEKNNNLYYFISDPNNFTDYIFQYNSDTDTLLPIVVDKYQIDTTAVIDTTTSPSNVKTHFVVDDKTNIRPGMTIQGEFLKNFLIFGVNYQIVINTLHDVQPFEVIRIQEDPLSTPTAPLWRIYMDETVTTAGTIFLGGVSSSAGNNYNLRANRALNFTGNQITGINIIDGIIYWTDGISEPKKIIIDNFTKELIGNPLRGTIVSGEVHSSFNVYDKYNTLLEDSVAEIDFRNNPQSLKEEHITVIKKSPLYPPTILMNNTSDGRLNSSGVSTLESTVTDYFIEFDGENLKVGTIKNITFVTAVDYVVGDLVLLRTNSFDDGDLDQFEIIIEILEYSYSTGEAKVKINFIQNEAVNSLDDPNAPTGLANPPEAKTFNSMLQQEKPLYEFKLPRFAYRYKYQDNQYSCYSPFSEPAFLPGDFEYSPKDGYNLGMVNTLRSVYVMDFVTDEDVIPRDVIEIDILYKESNSTNIYNIKTVKHGEAEWIAQGSVLNTLGGNYARTTGRIQITSEMVKSTVASNQLLRPWDNVPRTARAQEVVGNRIVYANYKQNYNL